MAAPKMVDHEEVPRQKRKYKRPTITPVGLNDLSPKMQAGISSVLCLRRHGEQLKAEPPREYPVRPTTIIEAAFLSERFCANIIVASEASQVTGSFKFRAAYHLVTHIAHSKVIAASSGNFGQALAYACAVVGKSSIIVMPTTSAKVKVDSVREYGGLVEFVDVNIQSRQERVSELAREHPEAYVASAYDDPLVIDGNSTLGSELGALDHPIQDVIVPIGGGGLSSGIIKGLAQSGRKISVLGAEPLLANDAARSLKAGKIVRNETEPQTIADGARTVSLGLHNWEILRHGLRGIVEVPEGKIIEGMKLLSELENLRVEPTGALSIGALLTEPEMFRHRCVCCVVSGGNVDPELYAKIIGS
jgi:threonine dehydratase